VKRLIIYRLALANKPSLGLKPIDKPVFQRIVVRSARLRHRNKVSRFSEALPRQKLFAVPALEPKSHRIIVC
jgi:hypothetical protein